MLSFQDKNSQNRTAYLVNLTKKIFLTSFKIYKNWTFYVLSVLYPGRCVNGRFVTGHLVNGRFVSWKFGILDVL
jgi:hypothetical protein